MTRILALAALAGLLAGCALGARIQSVQEYRLNAISHLIADGSEHRDVATIVAGNPFGVAPATLAGVVAAGLQGAFPEAEFRFATRPGDTVRRDVSMVVAFDPPPWAGPKDLCAAAGRVPAGAAGADIRVVAAFCHGPGAIVGIEGEVARGEGVGDPAFVGLIRDMARRMFEPRGGP